MVCPATCCWTSSTSPSSRGLGRGPFKAETRVRIPVGTPTPFGRWPSTTEFQAHPVSRLLDGNGHESPRLGARSHTTRRIRVPVSNRTVQHRSMSSLVATTAVIAVWTVSTVLAQQTQLPTPRKVKDVRPVYPPESLEAGDEGVIVLELSIGAGGSVEGTRILWSGCKRLEQAAVSAARQWKFEPIRVNSKPVPFKTVADIPFRLPTAFKSRAGRSSACKWTEPPKPVT